MLSRRRDSPSTASVTDAPDVAVVLIIIGVILVVLEAVQSVYVTHLGNKVDLREGNDQQ
jgi:hypothetical protein